jgi:N-acetylglucosamine-6-phosphate deacetylase
MTVNIVLTNCIIYTGETVLKEHSILIKDGKIEKIFSSHEIYDSNAKTIDLNGAYLIPGFIDLQLNGGGGVFFTQDIQEKTLDTIYKVYLESGTTSFLPTIITTSLENILQAIEVTGSYMKKNDSIVLGLHIEGPFFNVKKRGAHLEKYIRKATDKEVEQIAKKGEGVVKLLTAAPEMITEKQIKILLDAGINLSAGHTDVTYKEAIMAFKMGFRKVTHLFNAMSQFQSRNPGLVGAFLDDENIWGGIIVDGIHCDFAAVRLAHKLKKGKLFIVSDSSYVAHPDRMKEFDFGFGKIYEKNGGYYTENNSLAGAAITMLESVQNCIKNVGIDNEESFRMASTYPAQFLGIDNYLGKIKEGYTANIIVLNTKLEISKIFVKGKLTLNNMLK